MDVGLARILADTTTQVLEVREGVPLGNGRTAEYAAQRLPYDLSTIMTSVARDFALPVDGMTLTQPAYTITGDSQHWMFSVRRVLQNRSVLDARRPLSYERKQRREVLESTERRMGAYSSSLLVESLLANEDIVDILAASPHAFSLLGKLTLYDYDNPEETLFVVTKPLLIVPERPDAPAIVSWEKGKSTYEQEVGISVISWLFPLLKQRKQVSGQKYLRQSGRLSVQS